MVIFWIRKPFSSSHVLESWGEQQGVLMNLVALSTSALSTTDTAYVTGRQTDIILDRQLHLSPDLSVTPNRIWFSSTQDQKKIRLEMLESKTASRGGFWEIGEVQQLCQGENWFPEEAMAGWVDAASSETLSQCVYVFSAVCFSKLEVISILRLTVSPNIPMQISLNNIKQWDVYGLWGYNL